MGDRRSIRIWRIGGVGIAGKYRIPGGEAEYKAIRDKDTLNTWHGSGQPG